MNRRQYKVWVYFEEFSEACITTRGNHLHRFEKTSPKSNFHRPRNCINSGEENELIPILHSSCRPRTPLFSSHLCFPYDFSLTPVNGTGEDFPPSNSCPLCYGSVGLELTLAGTLKSLGQDNRVPEVLADAASVWCWQVNKQQGQEMLVPISVPAREEKEPHLYHWLNRTQRPSRRVVCMHVYVMWFMWSVFVLGYKKN